MSSEKPYRATIVIDPPIPISIEPPEGYVLMTPQSLKELYTANMPWERFKRLHPEGNRAQRRAAKRRRGR